MLNPSASIEIRPSDNVTLYFDAVENDQQRREESFRIKASGISDLRNVAVPSSFETVDFGSLHGQAIGRIQGVLTGIILIDDATVTKTCGFQVIPTHA